MLVYLREVSFKMVEISTDNLVTQAEAGKMLGITPAGVRSAMDAGRLPMIVVDNFKRKFTLKADVEKMAAEK